MINVKHVSRTVSFLAFLSVLSLGLGLAIQGAALSNQSAPSGEAQNMRLVGYHDLQGRESLQTFAKSDEANGDWVYVGHSNNYWETDQHMNPITGPDGVERDVATRCLRSCQSRARLAHTERH